MTIHIPTIVWAIVNFVILVAILSKFLYGPIVKMLDDRAALVKSDIDSANKAKEDAESLKAEYKSQIQKAQVEAQEIVATATKSGEATKNQIVNEAREEASKIKTKAITEIEEEKEAAIRELKGEISTLAIMASEKIIGRSLNTEDNKKLVNDFIEEVGELH